MPYPFNLGELCAAVGARRGRRLRVAPQPSTRARGGPCGVWVALADEDIIFIDQRTSSLHQEQIGLHEIGHILCRHDETATPAADFARILLPGLDPEMVQRVLGRTSYDTRQEQEAEMIATLLGERIRVRPDGSTGLEGVTGAEATDALRSLGIALGGKGPHLSW
jgi:hypothetical protein